MRTLNCAVIYNGIEGLRSQFVSNQKAKYTFLEISEDFDPYLSPFDVLIAPNGTDHVALYSIKQTIESFLERGGILFCFDGWFTDWVPGNRWVMDNSKKSIEMRYLPAENVGGILDSFSANDLSFSNGMSGWWSCGYIECGPKATVVLTDPWKRALLVVDDFSTNGLIILTASGPLGDASYATTDDNKAYKAMEDLYQGILDYAIHHFENNIAHV